MVGQWQAWGKAGCGKAERALDSDSGEQTNLRKQTDCSPREPLNLA